MTLSHLEFVTCSYAPDAERCQRLCRSMDRYVDESIRHTLIVPARDLAQFSALNTGRRRVVATQDVVPGTFRQLPIADKYWISSTGWPVRGWIMQQITKLSANRATDAEYVLFADSDLQFIRNFDPRMVIHGSELRLHREPGAANGGEHLLWHEHSGKLLGLHRRYQGADYVGQMITWRRSVLTSLQAYLERIGSRAWQDIVACSWNFSEYTLYGTYAEHVLGLTASGHYGSEENLCHCCWFQDEADQIHRRTGVINPSAVALLLQSNLGLSMHDEAHLLDCARQLMAVPALEG